MTEQNTPEPLVPADVDLRKFGFMPLDVRRLLTSETWLEAADDPKLGHALMCLWCEAWHQVPAASLPSSDRALARLSMCDMKVWTKIKARALKDWVLCSDGRFYHPVVAEKAMEGWNKKNKQRGRTSAATAARLALRNAQGNESCNESRNENCDDERDEERNVERDDQRNVHQERKREIERGRKKESKKEKNDVDEVPDSIPRGPYAFESGVIRLNEKDFDQWKKGFSHLDVPAELIALTQWAQERADNWYFAVQKALAKKNREIGMRIEQNKSDGLTNDQRHFKGIPGIQ